MITPQIDKIDTSAWLTLEDLLTGSITQEKSVTDKYNATASFALNFADHDVYGFCLEFLKEQREEHALFNKVWDKLQSLDKCPGYCFFFEEYIEDLLEEAEEEEEEEFEHNYKK